MINWKRIMFQFLFLVLALCGAAETASANPEPPILKGASITVRQYDKAANALVIQINTEKDVGPNYATVKDLIASVDLKDSQKYVKQPDRLVGVIFTLQKSLPLMTIPEFEKRKAGK